MSLFNSQTIFSLFITLLIGFALYYYIKYKYRVLELTQREQAKVLQSVIMTMNNNNQNIMNIVQNRSQEEVVSDAVNEDINRFRQVNSNNELIDVSDDSDSDSESSDDSDESSGESSESSDSECDSDQGDEQVEEQEVCDNTTRKILFTGNNDSHVVEHLDGPDIKVIELTHPLYTKNGGEEYRDDDGDDVDEDEDEDEDEDSDSESISSDLDGPHEPSVKHEKDEVHEIHEIKENVVINEINNSQTELETDNSLDNISVKAVFKTKDSETHSDYNSMNVQSLRQLLRNKLSSEGSHMSEASINKLTKRDLIKHLS
jgi:hypothetical protein